MSKRSGPERGARVPPREDLLKLAAAVADGRDVAWAGAKQDRVLAGLQVIAGLSERLGAGVQREPGPDRGKVLFQWGHLDVLEAIGSGASSEVFRAYDPLLAIDVALKLSRPGLGWAGAGEWIAEARRQARLRHPNIVAIHGVDRHDGRAGLWLDLIDGETLDAWGRRVGPLPLRELCLVGIELCRGLAAIHDAGLLHCDLKPANVLRGRDGRIVIADFGAAASARGDEVTGIRRGTPLTMAPEVLAGGEASSRSDLYGLGVVLYWLVSGRMPRPADDLDALRERHRQDAAIDLQVTLPATVVEPVAGLLLRLLALAPAERPDNAAEVESILAAALAGTGAGIAGVDQHLLPAFQRVLGREAEFAYLQQEYRRALAGQALPVLLVGESGTGKTALSTRFEAWLNQVGARMLRIATGAGPVGEPLSRSVLQGLMTLGAASSKRRDEAPLALAHQVAAAGVGPLVLCLDDLHRLHAADRTWLQRFASGLRGSSVLLLGLLRASPEQTASAVGLFADAPAALLRLRVFSREQTAAMIGDLLEVDAAGDELPSGLVEELHRLSGGNPFFLSELLRHLIANGSLQRDRQRLWQWHASADTLPPSLELAALQRCRNLPAASQQVLEAAAVCVDDIDIDALAQILGASKDEIADWMQPALDAGIVEASDRAERRLRFRHGLLRRALYDALAPEWRRELHARCVTMLRDADDPRSLAALSLHAQRAGDHEAAFAAGYAALPVRADDAPADLAACERLQALLDAGGVRTTVGQRWRLVLARLRALRLHGRLHDAQALAEQIQSDLAPRPDSRHGHALCLERAQLAYALGQHREVLALLAPWLQLDPVGAESKTAQYRVVRLLAVRAQAALGDYRQAEGRLSQALASDPGSRAQRLPLQTLLGWCIALQGRLDEADRALEQARHLARDASPAIRADLLRRLHWVRLGRGCYQDAHALALAAHELFRELGDAVGQAKLRMALAQVRLSQGLTEEAMGYLNRAGNELEDLGDSHCEAETRWLLARGLTRLGEFSAADRQLDLALDLIAQVGDRDDEFRFLIERARLRLAQRRPDQAMQAAEHAERIATELDSRDGQAFATIEQAEACLLLGDTEVARNRAEWASGQLLALDSGERWRADWLLGRCHLALAEPDAAVSALARAHEMVERIVGEFHRADHARRVRLQQAWQPLIDDHADALAQAGRDEEAARLRRRWQRVGQASR